MLNSIIEVNTFWVRDQKRIDKISNSWQNLLGQRDPSTPPSRGPGIIESA